MTPEKPIPDSTQTVRHVAAQDPENITAVAATEFSDRSEKAIIANIKARKGRI
ncbi:hypothetical protein GTO91_11495 [Heliobacterium undosum]|uniref:Uncharacterized protein n=1 Tax=Heliomicrobium undosum TaxID=121734 RepID=A0A845L5K1_9FIRM|nr:hypothetical protein [Heliomicrobium undosum]MZP30335.1 hypothetical protein [Heliomicrobium undosum]